MEVRKPSLPKKPKKKTKTNGGNKDLCLVCCILTQPSSRITEHVFPFQKNKKNKSVSPRIAVGTKGSAHVPKEEEVLEKERFAVNQRKTKEQK